MAMPAFAAAPRPQSPPFRGRLPPTATLLEQRQTEGGLGALLQVLLLDHFLGALDRARLLWRGQAALQLALDLVGILGLGLERQGLLPLEARFPLAANPPEGVTQMVVEHRILRAQLNGPLEMLDRLLVVAQSIVRPAEAVDDIAVVALLAYRFLDQRHPLFEIATLIDPGVAEIVEGQRLVRAQLQGALQVGFGQRSFLDALIAGAAGIEKRPMLLFGLIDQRNGTAVVLDRLGVALVAPHDPAQRIERPNVSWISASRFFQQLLGLLDALELVEVERLADFDADLQRRIVGYAVIGVDGRLITLGGLVGVGQGGERERKLRPQVKCELKIDRTDADAHLPRKGLAQPITRLG